MKISMGSFQVGMARGAPRTPFPEVPGIFSPLVEIGLTVWLKTGRAKAYLEYEPTISKYYSR